ncbi:MAG: gluconate 2-dehydrogenase subunit 3 family protein [Verrucomicrobiota bacterium]|jgi:hypothetical protein
MNSSQTNRLPRREAIKWVLAASATFSLLDWRAFGTAAGTAKGYGLDPNLLETYNPGDLWPLTLTDAQRRNATALCDVIIPADDKSPAASELHVVDFIDEWISAPYDEQQRQRETVVNGLIWLESESQKRFKDSFAQLGEVQQQAICNDIYFAPKAAPEFKNAANFFSVFRDLTAGGFYTTPAGWKDIGYVGNVALTHFDGPPPEVLKHVGLM